MTLFDIIKDSLISLFAFDEAHPLLFTQFNFWAFFAIVFALFSVFKNRLLLRNAFLFFVSVFFYYKTSGLFTLILLFVTVYNFFAGRWLYEAATERRKRLVLVVSIAVNLSTLCYFKYAYFLTDMINGLLGTHFAVFDVFAFVGNGFRSNGAFNVDAIMLPVGISFYTFQAISYIMDISRRRIEPVSNFLDFGFYVSFFPQLVAGPIVRANEFVPQLHKPFFLSRMQFGMAMFWIMNGLAKKIILSDYIAVNFIDRVFDNPLLYSGFENLMGLFGYSLQVYADFSGYTDIAIGVALILGFHLPVNFNSPYKATNPGGFWKRWHISLSKWLQDYLYIPLGGNRNATRGTYICIISIAVIGSWLSGSLWVAAVVIALAAGMLITAYMFPNRRKNITSNLNRLNTMLLGGLWHGASWNFMIWGGLNGAGMVVYNFWRDWNVYARVVAATAAMLAIMLLAIFSPAPLWNIAIVWGFVIMLGAVVRCAYKTSGLSRNFDWLEHIWSVFLTFVFITSTRLFFRSGSNLDPAEANETAWNTATNMVNQIGGAWDSINYLAVIENYWNVFALIVVGMIIHWLSDDWKRRYRIWFAKMPLSWMAVTVVAIVFVLYQFVTADLQKFIYFQF